jgi:hypothetical protein
MIKEVVRVATSNNFNCTAAEWAQLDTFRLANPQTVFFINCNIKTPDLLTINDHDYKAVITANPSLSFSLDEVTAILARLDGSKIAFVRVKYLPENPAIDELIETLKPTYRVVLTNQRFNGRKTMNQYSNEKYYHHDHNRWRLVRLPRIAGVLICDKSGKGCQACGICSRLVSGRVYPVKSLNLSTSGICPHSCPDCYAKTLQNFLRSMPERISTVIDYDHIKANNKQAGRTKHIKDLRAAALS